MTTEERLEKLERELACAKRRNRRMMIGAGVCLGMIFAWVVFAQPSRVGTAKAEGPTTFPALVDLGPAPTTAPAQREVRARLFILEDENGMARALLGMWGEEATLTLCGKIPPQPAGADSVRVLNMPRVSLFAGDGKAKLLLYDENGKNRAGLIMDKDGSRLLLGDENGKDRAWLGVIKDGPVLALRDENGKTRAKLAATKDGPVLALADENEKPRVGLGLVKDWPILRLYDEKDQTIWKAP